MSAPTAIRAAYSDIRTVKTRGVCQLVFEVPIEAMADAMAMLGPPVPSNEVWVGIARLSKEAPKPAQIAHDNEDIPAEHRKSLAQAAGYLCNIVTFRRFLQETGEGDTIAGTDAAAAEVRRRCGVSSRSELDRNPDAAARWRDMRADYSNWLRGAA